MYTIVASGTLGGQHWRLVRDLFVLPVYASPDIGGTNHLPMSHRGERGTQACDFTGLQWGDRPAGTLPDFNAGGVCNPAVDGDVERVSGALMGATNSGTPSADMPVSYFLGRVDATKVAEVAVVIQGVSTSRQHVSRVPGETDGYYVIFVPPLTFQQEQSVVITAYAADGNVAARMDVSERMPVGR